MFALCAALLMWVFQFRVLWMWIPRYLAVLVVWGLLLCMVLGGLDDVTFVGDVHGLSFLWPTPDQLFHAEGQNWTGIGSMLESKGNNGMFF